MRLSASEIIDQSLCNLVSDFQQAVLATVCVGVRNARGSFEQLRMICDTGAQVNLLTDAAFRKLNLIRHPNKIRVCGVGGSSVVTMGRAKLVLWHHKFHKTITAGTFTIVDKLGLVTPIQEFSQFDIVEETNNELADPLFHVPGQIDGILGISIMAEHLQPGLKRGPYGLVLQQTSFGWIVFGGHVAPDAIDSLVTVGIVSTTEIHRLIKKLWEIEEGDEQLVLSPEELACEEMYQSSLVHQNQRYTVTMLVKPDTTLGESRATAARRFMSLEKRFHREPEVREKYINFMREYQELGHMVEADPLCGNDKMHYYIPHHAVAIDRKFRVVFDASAKTSNGKSLNEIQYTGARQQRDLFDIVMNFRVGRIGMTADIVKMFRQIQVHQKEWNLQRILWRESSTEPLREFWLTVVTYGMVSSPFLATRR